MRSEANGEGVTQAANGTSKDLNAPTPSPPSGKVDAAIISLVRRLDNPAPRKAAPETPSISIPSINNQPCKSEGHGSRRAKKLLRFCAWLLLAGSLGGVAAVAANGKAIFAYVAPAAWDFVSETVEKQLFARWEDQKSLPLGPAALAAKLPPNGTESHQLAELRNETEWLRVRIDALNSVISKQIAEMKGANEEILELRAAKSKLEDEVTRLKEAPSKPEPHMKITEDTRRLATRANAEPLQRAGHTPHRPLSRAETRIASVSTSSASLALTPSLQEYSVRRVVNGIAVIQDRTNSFEVSVGYDDPDIGKVQSITRQGNRWVVQTSKGIIASR
jgi:hypothetical protein